MGSVADGFVVGRDKELNFKAIERKKKIITFEEKKGGIDLELLLNLYQYLQIFFLRKNSLKKSILIGINRKFLFKMVH